MLRGFFRLDRSGNRGFLVVNLIGDTARPEIVAAYPEAPWARVADTITEARALELLRAAIGVPEIPVVIEDIATWRATADVADRYQDGRIFLAGDAAHVVPPNGGFVGNTGVHDAHNLAWKLALVLAGTAGPELLAGAEISTLDLFGRSFVLLAGPGARRGARRRSVQCRGSGSRLSWASAAEPSWPIRTAGLPRRTGSPPPGRSSSARTGSWPGAPST